MPQGGFPGMMQSTPVNPDVMNAQMRFQLELKKMEMQMERERQAQEREERGKNVRENLRGNKCSCKHSKYSCRQEG